MPLPFIAIIGINIAIGLAMTALSYLLRPNQKKSNPFDSPTYGLQGMLNSYEPGTPLNLPYGTIQLPPAIINWYRRGNAGSTRAYFVGSLGNGQIAGVRDIKLNGLALRHFYSKFNKDALVYITHGEYQQKVYRFGKEVIGYLKIDPSGTSPTKTLTVIVTNSRQFQSASAKEPGYLLLYSQNKDPGNETYETVRYLSSSVSGVEWIFKGVRMTKTFITGDYVKQIYKIEKDDEGNVKETIPHIGSVTTFHQEINSISLTDSWSQIFTTNGKIDAFSTTFDFPEGLYKVKEGKYFPNQVHVAVRWSIAGSSNWEVDPIYVETLLSDTEYYININKNTNYAILCDIDGNEITAAEGEYDYLDKIEEGMEIEFTGVSKGITSVFRYYIDSVFTESTEKYTSLGYPEVRGKIKFKSKIKPSINDSPLYSGANIKAATYAIYYQKNTNLNTALISIPENAKTIQGAYQVTYQFPFDGLGHEEKMSAYKQYDIQYKLMPPITTHDPSKNANKIVITSIEDIIMNDFVYPGEALIGMRLRMTEKISGSLDNITAVVDGMLIKDTSEDISGLTQWVANFTFSPLLVDAITGQPIRRKAINGSSKDCKHSYRLIKAGTTGSVEPNWVPISGAIIFDGDVVAGTHCEWQEDSSKWSDNPLDIICDLQQNKMYGRGQYLDFDNSLLSDLYDSYNTQDSNGITDRQYVEQSIVENSRARKRLSVNINIDFRQPLMDTLEVLAKSTKGYNFWDGQKLLTYIDRYRTPVTMINNANIVPDSFVIHEVNIEDKINRIYASILNRYRKYQQDQVGRDYLDEGFAIGDLVMEQIHLYGITDKWHAVKILSYFLKYSKYIKHVIGFEQGIDGCIYDIGDVFYFSHEATNNSLQIGAAKKWSSTCGRVIAISGATFTTDKDITIANGQKVLLRTDTGTATEYTINSQVARIITCSTTIINVSINSIYSLGTTDINNEYYRLFTCISKRPKDYTYEIIAITYDDNVFKDIYSTAIPSQETSGTSISIAEENEELNEIDFSKAPPPPITHAIVKEDPLVQGEAVIYITRPISGSWGYAEIILKNIESEEWRFAGKTTGNSMRINGLIPGEIYEYEIKSYSINSQISDTKIHGVFEYGTDENSVDLPLVTGFQIANRMGFSGTVYGRSFKMRWDDMTSQTKDSLTYAMRKAGYENIKYYIEIYFPSIPSTVKIGNTSVKDMVVRHETIDVNKFEYDYEDTMEDISKVFESYSTHASYSTYYNVPIRTIKARLYCINNYSKKSGYKELTLTNPAPGIYLSDGTTKITPTLKKLKSGIRLSFPHPYDNNADEEYDISHFISERCENTNFTGSTLKKRKIMSSVTVNSNEEEVSDASYQTDYKGLDPKKIYYFRIKAFDVFGGGIYSEIASIAPGITDDDEEDEEEKIVKPETITGLGFNVLANGKLRGYWTLLSAIDITEYIYDLRAVNDTSASSPPTLAEIDDEVTSGGKACYGKIGIIMLSGSNEAVVKNQFIVDFPQVDYKYFFRVRAKNSSRKLGDWQTSGGNPAWTTHSTAVPGISSDNFSAKWAMYKFLGTVTAVDATHVSVTITGGTGSIGIRKKTQAGNTPHYINNMASTAFTGTKFVVFRGGGTSAGSPATLVLQTEAEMDADSTVQCAIAKVIESPSGKCNVLMMLSATDFNIAAYGGAFNQVDTLILTGSTIQTATSGSRVILDSSGLRAYNGSTQRVQISNDGSGWLGASNKLYWDTSGNLTVTGVTADSVAAEDIIAGTITGSTLQTASGTGQRVIITAAANEMQVYNSSNVKIATIGVTGTDSVILTLGTSSLNAQLIAADCSTLLAAAYITNHGAGDGLLLTTGNGVGLRATSTGDYAIVAQCGFGAAGIYAYSSNTGRGGIFVGNTTRAPLRLIPQAATPSSPEEGDVYADTDNKIYYHNGSAWKEFAFV